MFPNRTVTFHPSTSPPAEHTRIRIIPETEIHLRNSKTWIPVQIFDLITDHLIHTQTQASSRNCKPPYKDLIHTLSFITSYPITSELVSEIQSLLPQLHHSNKTFLAKAEGEGEGEEEEDKKADLWRHFDDMHNQWITLQRQRVSTAQKLACSADRDADALLGPRLPCKQPLPAALREQKNARALLDARGRATRVEAEVEAEAGKDFRSGFEKG